MIIVVKKQVFQNMYNERHLLRKKFKETGGFLANPEALFWDGISVLESKED